MRLGIDLIDVAHFNSKVSSESSSFLNRHFSNIELNNKNFSHLAGILAAKEAVFKTGFLGENIDYTKVIIIQSANGRPIACDTNMRPVDCLDISISHDGGYATAVAIWNDL